MNKQFPRFTSFLLMCLTFSLTATAQAVDIPDPNLRAAVETALGKASGAAITAGEMATLTEFNARDASISNLTGLSFATNLITLRLHNNRITDISPLSNLTELRGLYLDDSDITNISPLSGLIQLGALGLGGNNISDIASLAGLTHLKRLRLNHNRISDISALSNLIQLKELRLDRNNITDLSPLVANAGLGSGDEIDVQENPLSHTSIKTHIPTLQSRGVTVKISDTTNLNVDEPRTVELDNTKNLNFGEPRTVRLIYFLPNDRSPQQDIDTKLDMLIRNVQQFYADEMERHGFKGKTFTFETDATGKTVVHHVDGRFTDSYYRQNTFYKVWEEIREQFHTPQNIYFIAIDIGNERVGRGDNEVCGVGDSHGASGGHVLIPASGDCFNLKTAAHELGHAFRLQHDFRSDTYVMSFGRNPNTLSECAAEWLEAHRYFNTGQSQPHFDNTTKIQMLSPFASPPYAIRLRFEVTDPDGAHQAQLLTPATIRNQDPRQPKLLSCKRLNGETGTIEIELTTNQLKVISEYGPEVPLSTEVILSVIDVYGNFISQTFPIDITTILPTETVSTPDRNQALNIPEPVPPPVAVRQAFELDSFYQQWIDIEGFPVVASEKVNPYALKEAAWLIWQMIGHRPEILHVLVQKRVRFVVIGYTEIPTDIPDYSDEGPDFLTYKQRGFGGGGLSGHTAVSSSEENILHYPGDTGRGLYNVLIHEFAHTIHRYGLNTVDPTFNDRLQITYDAAMEKGLWQGTYASTDRAEYWAEATLAWFNPKGAGSFKGNTRQALKVYDPDIAALLADVYGDSEWRYTPPAVRLHLPHLQGFNPQNSPTFSPPPELEALNRQFRNPNSDGGDNWVDLRPYDPSLIPILNESRTRGAGSRLAYLNLTQADVLLYRVRYNGTESFRRRVPSGDFLWSGPRANKLQLIKDLNGRNLAVFQPVEKTGRILITEALNLITPGLSKVSGDNQAGVSGAVLGNPFVVEVRDENGAALEGISVTFTVAAGSGTLSVTRTITDENGQAESRLTLGTRLGTNTVSVSAAEVRQSVVFKVVSEAAIDIPDPNLRAAIEGALNKATGVSITASEMATLSRLEAENANISDLTGLEHAINLRELRLGENNISEISALSGLVQLQRLLLGGNSISNISVVTGLTQLTRLSLYGNNVSDLSPVKALTHLTELNLSGNSIASISPVAGLTNLKWLHLQSNRISDIAALTGLTNLTAMRLDRNSISDISALSGLPQLKELRLDRNNITDLSPLVANTGLGSGDVVDVQENPLSHTSIKTHIPTLQSRGVTVEFDDTTHLNVGEPRRVRLIYFLPNDRPYRADVVQRMKDEIRSIQTFYAEQMGAHGHGNKTFHVETDPQGEPMVHRVDGQHPNRHYYTEGIARTEIAQAFNLNANFYFIVIDTDVLRRNDTGQPIGGAGARHGKIGGYALVHGEFSWGLVAHEQGHGFGLWHDFRDGAYIMSYGSERDRLSACHAEYLAMHPYFNPDTSIEEVSLPIIELMSPRIYPAGSKSIPIQLKVSDSEGLHQVLLVVKTIEPHDAAGSLELKTCRGLSGKKEAIVEFEYDGVIPSNGVTSLSNLAVHPIHVEAVDTDGNVTQTDFVLFSDMLQPLSQVSGDNQHGLPNTPLPNPFIVEVRDLKSGVGRSGISITFTVTAGGGMLSTIRAMTDENGRAESTLTLGPNLGTNTVEVSAEGLTIIFNAVAGAPVDIPDPGLRAAIETALGKAKDDPITPSEMATLTRLEAPEVGILDLTGLEYATNLTSLDFWRNSVSDLSPIAGLTNLTFLGAASNKDISDVSALIGLTSLTELFLNGNSIADISPLAGLTNLKRLSLSYNSISDISALSGLTNLTWLKLDRNTIADISALANLTNLRHLVLYVNKISDPSPIAGLTDLTHLNLAENSISDISALVNLTNLTYLELPFNSISDLAPLVANTELGSGDEVDVRGNPLNYLSIMAHIPALQRRGVTVEFDDTAAKSPDINGDGNINVLDLILIASELGNTGTNLVADIDGNGVVDILDLILVAGTFEGAAAAPSVQPQVPETLTAVEVHGWLTDARALEVRNPIMKRGFVVLEQLLVSLTPKETELLANYPNPFNPETWIPYRLAEDAFVTLTIYDPSGHVIRTLDVGHRIASAYENRSKAIYWDGKNNLGEQVASGVYFYQLRLENSRSETEAGDYTATRKMVILK